MRKRIEIGIGGGGFKSYSLSAVKESARKLSLFGIVLIKDDGSIKVIAEGEEKNLTDFENELSNACFFLYTESFYSKWSDATEDFQGFSIVKG